MRGFAEASGMLIDTAAWGDQEGLERMLAVVNSHNTHALGDVAVEASQRMLDI